MEYQNNISRQVSIPAQFHNPILHLIIFDEDAKENDLLSKEDFRYDHALFEVQNQPQLFLKQ